MPQAFLRFGSIRTAGLADRSSLTRFVDKNTSARAGRDQDVVMASDQAAATIGIHRRSKVDPLMATPPIEVVGPPTAWTGPWPDRRRAPRPPVGSVAMPY